MYTHSSYLLEGARGVDQIARTTTEFTPYTTGK
jgi:hypothetical protein